MSTSYVPFEDKNNYDGVQRRSVGELAFLHIVLIVVVLFTSYV